MLASAPLPGVYDYTVLETREVASGVWCMLCASEVASLLAPGQFVNLAVRGDASHILRVPLSFAFTDADTITLYFSQVGEGTARLARMGRDLSGQATLVGPLGHGWELPREAGRALLVAGGIGLPPIVAAASMLSAASVPFDAIVGARDASTLVDELVDALAEMKLSDGSPAAGEVIVTTDDGSRGMRGTTVAAMADLVADHPYTTVYTCGPQVMLAHVAELAEKRDIACQVSLERMMACGFGACSCCNVGLAEGGYARCCQDGPVFDAREVAW